MRLCSNTVPEKEETKVFHYPLLLRAVTSVVHWQLRTHGCCSHSGASHASSEHAVSAAHIQITSKLTSKLP